MSPSSQRSPAACRLVIDGENGPAANMARDEALLESAAAFGVAAIRFYKWRPWSFSLGYFQRWEDFRALAGNGAPVVRRPSGGGAIWHADELTYSVAGPCGRGAFPRRSADIFEKVHRGLCRGLSSLGVDARLSDAPAGASPLVCFSRPQKYDIVVGERKLLGSAQRRWRGAFLQHGSLPLSPNEFAPGALSMRDVLDEPGGDGVLIDALSAALAAEFGLELEASRLTAAERREARRLERDKYNRPEWNRRR